MFAVIAPPIQYIPFILAERFQGTTPSDYIDMPADRRAYITQIMSIEGQINSTWEEARKGTEPGTVIWIAEWEWDMWPDD